MKCKMATATNDRRGTRDNEEKGKPKTNKRQKHAHTHTQIAGNKYISIKQTKLTKQKKKTSCEIN